MISQLSNHQGWYPSYPYHQGFHQLTTTHCPSHRWLQGFLHLTTRYRVSPTSQTIKDLEMFLFSLSSHVCLFLSMLSDLSLSTFDAWQSYIGVTVITVLSWHQISHFLSPLIRLHKFHFAEYPMKNHEKGDYEVFTQQLPAPTNELKSKRSTGFLASFCGYQWFCIIFVKYMTSF